MDADDGKDDDNNDDDEVDDEWCGYCGAKQKGWAPYEDDEEIPVCLDCMHLFLAKCCFSREKNFECGQDDFRAEVCAVCHEKVRNEPHPPHFYLLPPDVGVMLDPFNPDYYKDGFCPTPDSRLIEDGKVPLRMKSRFPG